MSLYTTPRSSMRGSCERRGRRSEPSSRIQSNYSLAGPWSILDEYNSDEGYGDNGRRPSPTASIARPFPRQKRGDRWRKKHHQQQRRSKVTETSESGKPEGAVGGGPAGHQGSPVRSTPVGETSGGPAARGPDPEDEDENGNTNWIESFADHKKGYSQAERRNSEDTLTAEGDESEDDDGTPVPNFWFAIRRQIREPLAEWLGTLIMVLMGVCANLQVMTSEGAAGNFSQQAAMWGLGTMMAIYIAGGVSGAHCNPMISINLSIFRGFPARKACIYICAQLLGAICAVAIAFGIYKDAILSVDPELTVSSNGTGMAFFTLPASFATPSTAFWTDFTSAAVLSGTVLAMGDDTNSPPGAGMHAFIIGLVGFALASCLGYNTGPQTNPAKDFASRLVPTLVGYGTGMWKSGWWAEAWAACILGGLFGCLVYDVAIFEGPESPINYPSIKRKKSRQGNKAKWLKTGCFGAKKKKKAIQDLENGIGINEKGAGHKLDGH